MLQNSITTVYSFWEAAPSRPPAPEIYRSTTVLSPLPQKIQDPPLKGDTIRISAVLYDQSTYWLRFIVIVEDPWCMGVLGEVGEECQALFKENNK